MNNLPKVTNFLCKPLTPKRSVLWLDLCIYFFNLTHTRIIWASLSNKFTKVAHNVLGFYPGLWQIVVRK